MQIWSLGWEDALEKGMATHPSILAWKILWTEEPSRLQSMESQMYVLYCKVYISSVQSLSRVRLFVTPMDCSTSGFPVHHQLLELIQIQVHWAGDAIQPSHPLLSPSPSAFNLSQHQGLFQGVSSLHQVVKVLALQLQHHSFHWIRTDFL